MVIHIAPGAYLLNNAPFAFNASTPASDIRLVGAFGTTLQASSPNASLFKVGGGAPKITLDGLQLHSQVSIDGGALHVQVVLKVVIEVVIQVVIKVFNPLITP